jgi:hypothetical protein
MKGILTVAMLGVLCVPVHAVQMVNYGWEDGGTVLGMYGASTPPMFATNVTSPVHGGQRSLMLEDNSVSGTPQAYVAWITGLQDGDVVEAGFWRYDTTPDAAPSSRIWAHWNDDPNDIDGYDGSASGNVDYGLGAGWDWTSYMWTVVDGHTGLVIEARTYSNPGDTVWIDDLCISAPDSAIVVVAPEPTCLALLALGAAAVFSHKRSRRI